MLVPRHGKKRARQPSPGGAGSPPFLDELRTARLAISHRAPDRLRARNRQVRRHPPEQIDALMRLIAGFGFLVPVLVDARDVLICGHARVEAARRLGLREVPVIVADHLTPEETQAFAIAENRMAELSSWDEVSLRLELADLVELDLGGVLGFEIDVIGFSTPQIDVILDGPGTPPGPVEEFELPDPGALAVSRPGDLWELGPHRLLCGDALAPGVHDRLLAGEQARMVFTDPPFNVTVRGHVSGTGRHREFAMASGEMSDAEFVAFLRKALGLMRASACDGAILMVAMDWRHLSHLLGAAGAEGLALINLCIWNKTNGGMGSLYRSKHEEICVFKSGTAPHVNNVELGRHGRYRTNVWDYAGVNTFRRGRADDLGDHPTVKPTALVADAIRDVTRRGDLVLDPFGGSGATLLAAEKTGRQARLIEIDPLYVDVAIRRWQKLTGRRAVHAETGETFEDRAARLASDAELAAHNVAGEAGHEQA